MSEGYFKRVTRYTPTRMWINNPTLGESNKAIAAGAVSCTTNPTYCGKMLANPEMRDIVLSLIGEGRNIYGDASDIAAFVQRKSVKLLMDKFLPVYEAAGGVNGFVSLQGDPFKEDDPANIINEALKDLALGKNFIAKIPTTEAGLEAIKYLCGRNVPVIATEIMSVAQCLSACEAYRSSGGSAPVYITCIAGIFDDCLKNQLAAGEISADKDVLFRAGCTLMREEYRVMRENGLPGRLLGGGARGMHHFTEFVGGECDITINWKGTADALIEGDTPVVERMDAPTPKELLDALMQVPTFAKAYLPDGLKPCEYADFPPVRLFRGQFEDGWKKLLKEIEDYGK